MRTSKRSVRFAALAVGLALVAAACGSDKKSSSSTATTTAASTASTTAGTETTTASTETTGTTGGTEATTAGSGAETGGVKMRVTYTLSDVATWDDGSPITAADFECMYKAAVNTPASITTTGYDQIISAKQGASPKEVVVDFKSVYAPWKTLFNLLLKADQHKNCEDVSADFATGAYTYGAGAYKMTSWSAEQVVYEKNAKYKGKHTGGPNRIVLVPAEDGPTLLKSGTVDFIYPQAFTGIDAELADPNVKSKAEPGGQFEALYFMQDPNCTPDETRSCAFADKDFREAYSKSIDLDGLYQQIYAPFAQGIPLLQCGPIAPGPYCDPVFTNTYDPTGAEKVLTDAGWAKNADGFWAKDGKAPEIHWMVNTGNTRRESAQEFLIPKLKEAGFNVRADNCEATPCVFQTRLPAEKYDMAMYISTVAPDPSYLTNTNTCDQVPSEDNDFKGQNSQGWCNKEATAALHKADSTLDEAERAKLVKSAIVKMKEDYVLLPTLQFPNIGAYRTDKVDGTQSNLANYWAFKDWWNFKDLDGDGSVVIGAEQFPAPDCTNPITECSNSSWFQWVAGFPTFPGMYDTTNEQTFEPSEYLAGEAKVETEGL